MFDGLKSYFLSLEKCPNILEKFFSSRITLLWLKFLADQLEIYYNTIKQLEGNDVSMVEVSLLINDLTEKLTSQKNSRFLTSEVTKILEDLVDEGIISHHEFYQVFDDFFDACINYVNKWNRSNANLNKFCWICVKEVPKWSDVENSLIFFSNQDKNLITLNENLLFDEFVHVKNIMLTHIQEWNENKIPITDRWLQIFHKCTEYHIDCENLSKMIHFVLSLPGTNACVERIFSLVNMYWADEKSRLDIKMVKAVVTVKTHFNLSCIEFYEYLLSKEELLRAIHSSKKYY